MWKDADVSNDKKMERWRCEVKGLFSLEKYHRESRSL